MECKHNDIKHYCDDCNFFADTKSELKHHEESVHEGIIHPCSSCDYVSDRKASLKAHMRWCRGQSFTTEGKKYKVDSSLVYIIKNKPLRCEGSLRQKGVKEVKVVNGVELVKVQRLFGFNGFKMNISSRSGKELSEVKGVQEVNGV